VIWATHHQALSAPYHRSASALSNGLLPYRMTEEEMAAYLRAAGARHVLVCAGSDYGPGFATALAQGAAAAWLTPVPLDTNDILLFTLDGRDGG
jgi:hypothetical protein